MALVLIDHALLHRAQNADVRTETPTIAASSKKTGNSFKSAPVMKTNNDPAEA
jgi:chorismate synthase